MHPCSDGFGGSLFNQTTNSRRVLLSFVFSLGVTLYKVVVYAVRIIFYLFLLGKQNEVINQSITETLSMGI